METRFLQKICRTALLLGLAIPCVILESSVAHAYIPPSQFILKTWLNKHNGFKTVRIRTTVSGLENNKPTEVHFKDNTVINFEKQTVKYWATDDAEKRLYVSEKGIGALSILGKLLFSTDVREVMRLLKEKKIPVRTEDELLAMKTETQRIRSESGFLSRLNNTIAWVIGTPGSAGSSEPQIWFEKDTFLPLRFIYSDQFVGDLIDVRFDSFRFQHEFPYPRNLTVSKRGKDPFFSSQLIEISVNVPDAQLTKGTHGHGSDAGFTDAGHSASGSVRDLIRMYYDVLR